jgi:cytoskeleton protein RodZ
VNAKTSDPTPEERVQNIGPESSLGAQLRRAREAHNVSLRDISDQTRISRRYLEAIEADDYKNLPGGIFNRSFVKAFARAVGFNETDAIRAYERTARAQGESPDELPTSRQPSRLYTDGESPRSPLVTVFLSIVILTVISLGVYAALHWYQRRHEANTNAPPPTNRAAPVNPNAQPAPPQQQPTATPTVAPQGLNVQVKAKGEEVWLSTRVDNAPPTNGLLAADQVKQLTANDSVTLRFSKAKVNVVEVTINGRLATLPTDAKAGIVQLDITKENYASLWQQP